MYNNPYQTNSGGYPPPTTPPQGQGYPHGPPPGAPHGAPQAPGYPPPHGAGYPQGGYPPPQGGYPGASSGYPGAPGYPPNSGGYPPGSVPYSQSTYPQSPPMYAPPPSQPGAPMYPPQPHPTPSTAPYGAPVASPYGPAPPFPEARPTGLPTAVPTPMPGYPHTPGYPPTSPTSPMMQSPYAPMSSIPQAQYQPASPFRCGPLLRYQNLDIHQGIWIGSILVVSRPENQGQPPVLTWSDNKTSQNVTAEVIEGYQHSYFWRYSLRIPQEHQVTKTITYSFNNGPAKWYFYIAGRSETFRWMFYSCNGFSSSTDARALGGANPLWNDMMSKHAVTPYHVMLGGGDQLYCDGLLNEPEMMEWLNLSSTGERERAECTPRWTMAIEKYYFNRYCEWFSSGTYAQALAMIPSVNMWDDHDTIDGYGSYPDSMQNSRVLSKIGEVSRRFYLLFQHHSTPALAPHHGFFSSGIGFNILTSLGPKTSILVLDARSERTKTVVCSNTTYEMAYAKMYQEIPQGTEHLLVLLGVPIAYPRLVFAENLMGSVGSVLGGIAGAAKVVNKLNGEPELLDDLNDHWTAKLHKSERNRFLTKLQEFSNTRRIRVTFLSGDVHCAGVGRFTSKLEPERDPQLMYQIISSAIVNEPPPEGVIKLLHFQDKVHVLEGRVKTYEDMYPIFTNDVDGRPLQMDKLLPRRNYSHGHYNPSTGSLDITIFAENIRAGPDPSGDRGTKPYYISAPRLY